MKYKKSIELLNRAVADELAAIHQYMYFHFHCDDQGYDLLANLFKMTAITEMTHVEKLAERILFLKGDVKMNAAHAVKAVKNVKEMLELARQMEEDSAKEYNQWANECAEHADAVSRQLFESLVADEEKHYDNFDKELDNINQFGSEYLALQSIERSKTISKNKGKSEE
ncbi:MAG: bacterioferritin [Chitinophagales bacterium]|nr:MAG: bacterioferritin [Chitinophagales bacterium]